MEQRDLNFSEIVQTVESGILGRVANKIGDVRYNSLETLLHYVSAAGEGNHIEIGTLFGGSAIAVALLKKGLGQSGLVMCIDPMNGYYAEKAPREDCLDVTSGRPVVPKTFFKNLERFEVEDRVCLIKSSSENVVPLMDMKFTTAYIDGKHDGGQPYEDWRFIKDLVTDYIIFDNYDDLHIEVRSACERASHNPRWETCGIDGITYILKRAN